MTTTSDLDPRIADWLAAAPETPATLVDLVATATSAIAQPSTGWRDRLASGRTGVRLATRFAAVLVMAVAIGLLVRALIPDSRRVVAPPSTTTSPAPTAERSTPPTATPTPNSTPAPSGIEHPSTFDADLMTRVYHSARYGFTIRYPADWSVTAAAIPWVPDYPWIHSGAADEVRLGPQVLSIAAAPLPSSVTPAALLETWRSRYHGVMDPEREGVCTFAPIHKPGPTGVVWRSETVKGHDAYYRAFCGYNELVVFIDGTAWVISMFTEAVADPDRTKLDVFVSTMTFPP